MFSASLLYSYQLSEELTLSCGGVVR